MWLLITYFWVMISNDFELSPSNDKCISTLQTVEPSATDSGCATNDKVNNTSSTNGPSAQVGASDLSDIYARAMSLDPSILNG